MISEKTKPAMKFRDLEQIIRSGLHKTKHPGRFEIIRELSGPSLSGRKGAVTTVILDGAHNVGGAEVLAGAIRRYYPDRRIIGIAGMLSDKDHEDVLGKVEPLCNRIFTVSTPGERGYSASDLAAIAIQFIPDVTSIGGIEEALELALMDAKKKDVILVFGTLSVLGAAKRYLTGSN